MNRKILISLLVIGLTIGLVGGATFAFFFDTETSAGNTFTAGTLDLTVDGANDPLPVKFTVATLKPGDSGTITYVLNNTGTIDGFIDLQNVTVMNAPGATPEPEPRPDAGELGANMNIVVTVGSTQVYNGSLDGFAGNHDTNISLAAGATTTVAIAWSIPTTVGNIIQGDVATVGITFELAQTAGQ